MKIRMRPAMALLIVGALVAACGSTATAAPSAAVTQPSAQTQASTGADATAAAGSTAAPGSTGGTDACALITEAEATKFLGSDPGSGMDTGTADAPACAYGASLTLGVALSGGKSLYESQKGAMQGSGKAQALSGVGDDGFVFIVANTIAQMAILKGDELLTVNVQGNPSLQNITLAALTALGTTAVGRL